MNENDKHFIKRYEELLNKGYCDCNEMNCIDNNSPRRILNIVNNLQSKIDKINLFKLYLQERLLKHKDGIEKGSNEFDERNECEDILKEFINFFKEDK